MMRLWDFCEQFYSDKRVELLCLDLQNRYQANVSLVLWLCWLAKMECFVSSQLFEQAKSLSLSFHESYIAPVRTLRKNAQVKSFNHAPSIIKHLLSAEITLERELLELFEAQFSKYLARTPAPNTYGLNDYLLSCQVVDSESAAQFLYAGAKSINRV